MASPSLGRSNTTGLDYSTYRSVNRFAALDGLRAISVIAVIWQHTAGFNAGRGITARGYLGVDCFFVISGFLITTLLLREESSKGSISLRNFYVRRAARIFPVYYVVLAMYLAVVLATRLHTADGREFIHNLPTFLTYTSNWFVDRDGSTTFYFAWSLATEEQFYLFWPPLLAFLLAWYGGISSSTRIKPAITWVTFLIGLSLLGRAKEWAVPASLAIAILLGAGAAVILHEEVGYRLAARWLGSDWAAPAAAVLALVMIQIEAPDVIIPVFLLGLVVACVVRENTLLHPLLKWRPLVLVGGVSYGVYLMHMLVANLVRPVIGHRFGITVFLATVPIVCAAAYVSFRWFESPIQKRARRRTTPLA